MTQDPAALYSALASRDSRFDGVFYVGVTSTGIYCRPVCTAKTPKAANCRFFDSREAAEKARFRPCLRCRPELAPGTAPVDDAHRIASLVAQRIDEGMLDDGTGLERIAAQFGWSSRQIRRIVHNELGVSPIELALTRRLLLAKQLLTETTLPITDVAFASGFSSLRRFNDAFSGRYGMPPTRFRKAAENGRGSPASEDTFTLQLSYRRPSTGTVCCDFLRRARSRESRWSPTVSIFARLRWGFIADGFACDTGRSGELCRRAHPLADSGVACASPAAPQSVRLERSSGHHRRTSVGRTLSCPRLGRS